MCTIVDLMASLSLARHWKAYSPIAKKAVWRCKSIAARQILLDHITVVCVLDDLLQQVEDIAIFDECVKICVSVDNKVKLHHTHTFSYLI